MTSMFINFATKCRTDLGYRLLRRGLRHAMDSRTELLKRKRETEPETEPSTNDGQSEDESLSKKPKGAAFICAKEGCDAAQGMIGLTFH